jgi:hypothetical protein
MDFIHVVALSEMEDMPDFRTAGFVDRLIATVMPFEPALVAFNCFDDLGAAGAEADSWNAIVRVVARAMRLIVDQVGCTVAIIDHQEDMSAEHAHGGRMKKRSCDLYLRVHPTDTTPPHPDEPHNFKVEDMRKNARLVVPSLATFAVTGARSGALEFRWHGHGDSWTQPVRISDPGSSDGWDIR